MKPFDLLLLTLVLFPLFTGGFWIDSPDLHLEFNEITPGVALLSILTLWYRWRNRNDLFFTQSRTSRILSKWKTRWHRQSPEAASERRRFYFLTFLGVGFIWSLAALRRHWSFHSGAADLGIFTNVLWNLNTIGAPYSSIKGGINFYSDHPMLTLGPISWIFRFFPHPEFLLVVQSFSLASGGLALALLLKQRGIRGPLLWISPMLVWAYSPVRAANLFDFHPETLMFPLFLFGIFFLQELNFSRRLLGLALLVLGALSKESGGPLLFAVSLAWIFGAGPFRAKFFLRRFGYLSAVFALFLFWFHTKFLPSKFGTIYTYSSLYEPFGTGILSLLFAPIQYPVEFFRRLFGLARLKFLFFTSAPLVFVPFSQWRGIVTCAIPFVLLFLAAGDQRLSLGFHYGIEPAVALFFAFSFSVGSLKRKFENTRKSSLVVLLVIFSALFFKKGELVQIRRFSTSEHAEWLLTSLVPKIPHELSVSATSRLVPHLATRKWIQILPELKMPSGSYVDCVIWDTSLPNDAIGAEAEKSLQKILEKNYQPMFTHDSLTIFSLKNQPKSCII